MKTEVIRRDAYLNVLVRRKHNNLVKVITGVRRCGKSYLLSRLFKQHLIDSGVSGDHIIEMSFDIFDNRQYRNAEAFYAWVTGRLKDEKMHYILLDEVQLLEDFVSVLNGLAIRDNCDVYVTGSNAKFLSKDIATEFGGRSIELQMHPLSFVEFMSFYKGDSMRGLREYMRYGGIPLVVLAEDAEEKKTILKSLVKETYLRDIVLRNNLKDTAELEELFDVLASSIGGLINPAKLQHTFQSVKNSKITAPTILKYLDYLKDAFLIEEVRRYDIKGRKYIGTPMKYYFADIGLCKVRLDFRQEEIAHEMENVIYNELRRRGYSIDIGNLSIAEKNKTGTYTKKFLEIDFVCSKDSEKFYIQSAYSMNSEEKTRQELRGFEKLRDGFKRIVVTYEMIDPYCTKDGIHVMNIIDLLLGENLLI